MRILSLAIPAVLAGFVVCAQAATILPGTQISVRPDQPIEVAHWDQGRIYSAHTTRDVYARDGDVAIPAGSQVELVVRKTGPDEYALDLESITANGRRYALDATGPQYHMPRAEYDNGGGLVGAIQGAIAGAQGENVQTHGREIHVPPDAELRFQVQEPLHIVQWPDPGYSNNGHHYHHDQDWYR